MIEKKDFHNVPSPNFDFDFAVSLTPSLTVVILVTVGIIVLLKTLPSGTGETNSLEVTEESLTNE